MLKRKGGDIARTASLLSCRFVSKCENHYMVHTVSMCPKMEMMLGGVLYSNRKICSIVEGYGVTQYFLPKTNETFLAKGVKSWKLMLYKFMGNPQE